MGEQRITMQTGIETREIQPDIIFEDGSKVITVPVINRAYKHKMQLQSHEPKDFSDVGQATVFVEEYGDILRWTPGTGFLVYDGQVWHESDTEARKLLQELTALQLSEAKSSVISAQNAVLRAAEMGNETMKNQAAQKLAHANAWHKYVLKRRDSSKISNALTEAQPMVSIDISELDADPFLLNTPAGTIDLNTGELREHNPEDLQTKITAVAPDHRNHELFDAFLNRLTENDTELQEYLQEVVGMCAVGKVFTECLLICQGSGGNGKSTFWGVVRQVLGEYATVMDADTLTIKPNSNNTVFNAELRGRRLAIYPELGEGVSLDMGQVKKISSVDPIQVSPKYKKPFEFVPSHTPVLYTNPLPSVKSSDEGSWDRLVLIPFRARFRGAAGEIKHYDEYLLKNCGGAVLSWIIEGAKKFIANGCMLHPPECVREATETFHQENDWFQRFEANRCETGADYTITPTELYTAYKNYCIENREAIQTQQKFKEEYLKHGYPQIHRQGRLLIRGVCLKSFAYTEVSMPTPWKDQ